MNPLYFGPSDAPLYGVYHPPKSDPRPEGVLLCNAFGQEYMRAHRAYRQLAGLLTRKGFHVFRFDYRGTGDSSGDLEEVSANDWLTDIDHAVDELRDSSGVESITVLGMRLGALLAASASTRRADLKNLIIWDPISSGSAYEQELLTEIAQAVPSAYSANPGNGEVKNGDLHYNGFTLARGLRESLRSLDASVARSSKVQQIFQVVSHESADFTRLKSELNPHPGYRYQVTAAPHDWNYVDNFGGILLPQPIIQAIVQWMEVS